MSNGQTRNSRGTLLSVAAAVGIAAFAAAPVLLAGTAYWGGGDAADPDSWHNDANWVAGMSTTPGPSDTAFWHPNFVNDTSPYYTIDVTADAAAWKLQSNGNLNVPHTTIGLPNNPSGATLTLNSSSSIEWNNGNSLVVLNVNMAINDSTQWLFNRPSDLQVHGEVNLGANTLTLHQSCEGSVEFGLYGIVSGNGGLVLRSPNNAELVVGRLTAANTYTGGTEIENGAHLILDGGTLANSNILIGDGTSASAANLLGDATNKGTLRYNIDNDAADLVTVAANGTLYLDDLNLDFQITGTQTLSEYIIADYAAGALNGTAFSNVSNLPSGWSIDYAYDNGTKIALVPEPVTLSMMGLGLAVVIRRRRA